MSKTISKDLRLKLLTRYLKDTNEYRVEVYLNGVYSDEDSYYTDNMQDALTTRDMMLEEYNEAHEGA